MTTTIFFFSAGVTGQFSSSTVAIALSAAAWAASAFTVIVTLNSLSEIFSECTPYPFWFAIFVRFCTAISLSTSVSTVPPPCNSRMAFFVFTTGIGQASPIAFTLIMIVPPFFKHALVFIL